MSQTTQNFSSESPPIHYLIQEIDMGILGLPDLQRPFVWKRSRIRDLFDSLYRGFPAGYFLFWDTKKKIDSHSIGSDTDSRENQKMIVDGQQRLTSLYAVMKGKTIINDGKIFRDGSPEELGNDPEVKRVYLGETFTFEINGWR